MLIPALASYWTGDNLISVWQHKFSTLIYLLEAACRLHLNYTKWTRFRLFGLSPIILMVSIGEYAPESVEGTICNEGKKINQCKGYQSLLGLDILLIIFTIISNNLVLLHNLCQNQYTFIKYKRLMLDLCATRSRVRTQHQKTKANIRSH